MTMHDQKFVENALNSLAAKDEMIAKGLSTTGYPSVRVHQQGFPALVRIIIAQQISKQAADSIGGKLINAFPDMEPQNFIDQTPEALRKLGLSLRKANYMIDLAKKIYTHEFDPLLLSQKSDDEIISEICSLKGFGRWSGEIYGLFALGRADIFPANDLALQEAIRHLFYMQKRMNEKETRSFVEKFTPYRGVFALFLWHYYHKIPTM